MHRGYFKVWRKGFENPWMNKSDYLSVWIHLLNLATHKNYDIIWCGKRITLQPGQLITSRPKLQKICGVERSKLERILKTFENEQQIEQQTSNISRLITIVNWNLYQQNEQQNEQQVSNKRATSEQQVSTNNNIKNIKNIKNILSDSEESNEASSSKIEIRKPNKPRQQEIWFESLWKLYPSKTGKTKARKYFLKSVKTETDLSEIQDALKIYQKHLEVNTWKEPQNGCTWFNSWKDWLEFEEPKGQSDESWEALGKFLKGGNNAV